jgi:hypothetical protein
MKIAYMQVKKLAIAATFYYSEDRGVIFLEKVAAQFSSLADKVIFHLFTNIYDNDPRVTLSKIIKQGSDLEVYIHTYNPSNFVNPYFLTWTHVPFFKYLFESDNSITHFMYIEADMLVTRSNIDYWLHAREQLRSTRLVPSFLRYELNYVDKKFYSTDLQYSLPFVQLSRIQMSDDYFYLNLKFPYQAMYLLDRELMQEHLEGPFREFLLNHIWGVPEQAAGGITFLNVPSDFYSRNVIGFNLKTKKIDPNCLVHHLPNNFANDIEVNNFGKVLIDEAIIV